MDKHIGYVHFIGIKGVGMSALAVLAKQKGLKVTGSDMAEEFVTNKILEKAGIDVKEGFSHKNYDGKPDVVVYSAAYGDDNPEIQEAKKRHWRLLPHSEMLGEFMADFDKGIAVAGVHGKTTTTAMIAYLLEQGGKDPSYAIGAGNIPCLEGNAKLGKGEYFVVEADEYKKSPTDITARFLDLKPYYLVITSIELDHPDVYPTTQDIYDAFFRLAARSPRQGIIFACTDNLLVKKLSQSLADRRFETYGFGIDARWQIIDLNENEKGSTFNIKKGSEKIGPFIIKLPGRYNVLNVTAAILVALECGVSIASVQKALPNFSAPARRFQIIGNRGEVTIIDDYAHHPTAIKAVLDAAKKKYPNRKIVVVFQPHTYSRTFELFDEFAKSFSNADEVIIADIYASAREKQKLTSSKELAKQALKYHRGVSYIGTKEAIVNYLKKHLHDKEILIIIGAGDIYKVAEKLVGKNG